MESTHATQEYTKKNMAAFNVYTNLYLPMKLGKQMAKSSGRGKGNNNDDFDAFFLLLLILFVIGMITLLLFMVV